MSKVKEVWVGLLVTVILVVVIPPLIVLFLKYVEYLYGAL